jgi:uncharacterized protein (DUF1800 family)
MLKRTLPAIVIWTMIVVLNVSAQPAAALTETDKIVHLLNRAAYGPRPGDVERVRKLGLTGYIEQQLYPEVLDDSALEPRLALLDTLKATPVSLKALYTRDPRPVVEQLQGQKVIRAIYSERQLQEVMTDFWFNHFNVNWSKEGVQFVTTSYERDAIRPRALGKFKDLLLATAKHPAMLVYLDNAMSSAAGINENYARELMELHTLGVNGGYLQKDVEQVARAFTGWTITEDGLAFQFRKDMHAAGNKVLLEQTILSGGVEEGEAVLDILTHHPSTANFIATKLARRFVSDNPPPALVRRVAQVFTETDGNIRAMVRTILTSSEFSAPDAIRAKTKSPFEAVVSSMRAVNATLADSIDSQSAQGAIRGLPAGDVVLLKTGGSRIRVSPAIIITRVIQDMGQFPYQNPEPTGYPDRSDYWMSGWTVLNRTKFAVSLVNNEVLGTSVSPLQLARVFRGNEQKKEDSWKLALAEVLAPPAPATAEPASPERVNAAIQAYALALGSPDFQQK